MGRIERRKHRKWTRALRYSLLSIILIIGVFTFMTVGLYFYAKTTGPPSVAVSQSNLIYSIEDKPIGERNFGEKRYWQSLENIAPDVIDATIAIEDRKFYKHSGFDYKRIAGAIVADVKAMAKVQGASTISQQYARNLHLSHEKTWTRKFNEALYTVRLEWNYDKDKILEGYLNTIYYGHGAYGIEAASQFYFGIPAKELTLAQAAMLAGVPKSPSGYSPVDHFEKAKERQELILSEMVKNGVISQADESRAISEKLEIAATHPHTAEDIAPYFQDAVWAELEGKLGLEPHYLKYGGLKIYTTLDPKKQKIAEEVMAEVVPETSDIEVGFAALNPSNGYVEALIGGRDYEASPFNRMTQAVRQPGSTLKPILYTAALEHGFTPATTMVSEQTTFSYDNGRGEYSPENFNHKFANDAITLAQAIAISDNIFAVKTHQFLGEKTLGEIGKRFGLTTKIDHRPAAALGTSEVVPIQMVNSYNLFANGGNRTEPVLVRRVETSDGKVIYENKEKPVNVVDPKIAFVMAHMLTGTFDPALNDYSTVTGITLLNEKTREYGAKSGTTNSDQWMIGFSPSLTAGIWTGYDNGQEITLSEDKAVSKLMWIRFMERALEGSKEEWLVPPDGVVAVNMDPHTGMLSSDQCEGERTAYFVNKTEPIEACSGDVDFEPPGEPVMTPPEEPEEIDSEGGRWLDRWF
ncbi:transglycosylase domain-containing protein [Jeotgalibacillus proteolyticus]|uniref:Monofunctional biosynthetic peptidoglycan transglycosylase n=1 Tax=Jeotgalibacillus proteolyticus TaxID=2082395 RepID=A0A2S5G9U2_9BACL|nr:PBP1A family penicillin-binding protein [Jeotgalibacillus proteolyticus]PPA69683.1 monofunctional biosynthetic peptidoglycan transglycosylase [Jeotgalibacillus proteolyticus]